MVELDMEVVMSPGFWILAVVGYAAFGIMLVVLKGMEQQIIPFWVKIVVILAVPAVAYFFASRE